MVYKCEHCEYETSDKSNLNRHNALKHAETVLRYSCNKCDCVYVTAHNLKRHMVTKHSDDLISTNTVPCATNTVPIAANTVPIAANTVNPKPTSFMCAQCQKTFAKRYNLQQHTKRCKGVCNSLECHLCHKIFTDSGNKSRHMRTCRATMDTSSVLDDLPSTSTQTADTINNIQNQQNIQNQHNGDNNFIINFPTNAEPMEFYLDHIKVETLRQALMNQSEPDAVLIAFTRMILNVPENQCVEKTSMRSDYSHVHIGNGHWELQSDDTVYPTLVSNIALSASDFFHSNQRALLTSKPRFDEQQRLHDYVADNGYCADDKRAIDARRKYRKVVRETKAIAYNATKKKVKPRE